MTELLQPYASDREADRRAREWLGNLDHQSAVGSRHHIVPRFLLARFASPDQQLMVRRRSDGKASTRKINDLAVRDFYTAVTISSEFDSTLESIFSVLEGGAAEVFRRHLDARAFARARSFTAEERATIDAFVATQAVRGTRVRRSLELIADYTIKLLNQDKVTGDDIQNTSFVPHPNEHLKIIGVLAERAEETLRSRATCLLHIDEPLLIIGDEPVLIDHDEFAADTLKEPPAVDGNLVLIGGGQGFAKAEAIMLPVSSSAVLMYGPPEEPALPYEVRLTGANAHSFASEVNQLTTSSAIEWIAAHPEHPEFDSLSITTPRALLTVHDYGSPIAAHVNSTSARRPIRRLRRTDLLEARPPHT